MRTATSPHLEGLARVLRRDIARLVTIVRGSGSKRTRISASAQDSGVASAATLACDEGVDLVVGSGSFEPVAMHGGVFGYKDGAGVRHPLF